MNYLLVAIPVVLLILTNAMLFVNWRRAERRATAWMLTTLDEARAMVKKLNAKI